MSTPRVTLKQIASRAGLHHTTISLALRNRPELPVHTRERIKALAEEMGYRPDPTLSALRAHRPAMAKRESRFSIAYVSALETAEKWRSHAGWRACRAGAAARAAQLGYHLEDFWYDPRSMKPKRATQILRARNISGLLISGALLTNTLNLNWEHFAAVSLTPYLENAPIALVTNNHLHTMRLACENLHALGYRRIGLAIQKVGDEVVRGAWSIGFAGFHAKQPASCRVPLYLPSVFQEREFLDWRKRYRPDVVLTIPPNTRVVQWLGKEGLCIPDDIGIATLDRIGTAANFTGIYQNFEVRGTAAVDFVAGLIQRNALGWPEHPVEILTRGDWIEGKTTISQL